ncbi:hypothetical protein DRQ36_09355 [bacterium]|nr:MAG: hypothetical protein DRQ36_09355 [bacterium]
MGRKTFLLSLILVVLLSQACAEETVEASLKTPKKQTIETYEALEDALLSGKPVVALFHTTKGCACTLKRCKTSIVLVDDYMESLAADLAYVRVDIGINRQQGKNYKIFGAPTVVFFDSAGNEVKRLNSWEIKVEIIDPILSEISKSANEPKTEK